MSTKKQLSQNAKPISTLLLPDALSHHAYLVCGNYGASSAILSWLQQMGMVKSIADVAHLQFSTFGIDDARQIKFDQVEKTVALGKRIFIIETTAVTHEAQDALLKVFEDPSADSVFFFIIENGQSLRDTFKSRFAVLVYGDGITLLTDSAREFVSANVSGRFKIVTSLLKRHESDEDSALLRRDALSLLSGIETLYTRLPRAEMNGSCADFYQDLLMNKSFLSDRSASVKMILEYCALTIPRELVISLESSL